MNNLGRRYQHPLKWLRNLWTAPERLVIFTISIISIITLVVSGSDRGGARVQSIRRHYWGTLHFAQTHIASTSSSSSPSSLSQSPSHKDWVSSHFTVQFCLWNSIFVWRVDDDDFLDNLLLIISWKRESFWSMPVKLHQCSKFDIFYNMEILRPGEHPGKPDRFLLNELECWMYAKQCCVLCLFIQLSRNPQFVKDVAFSGEEEQNRRNLIQTGRR